MAIEMNTFEEASRLYDQLVTMPVWKVTQEALDYFQNKSADLLTASMANFEQNFWKLERFNQAHQNR